MKVTVINNSKFVRHLPINRVVLYKGKNTIKQRDWEDNLKQGRVKLLVEKGLLEVPALNIADNKESDKPQELANPDNYTISVFIEEYVGDETDLDTLEKYLEQEKLNQNRVGMVDNIQDRLNEVK